MKLVADTLGVARSNLVDHLKSKSKPRGRYRRQGDDELIAAIRQLTDARPTYGYRRITALLNRALPEKTLPSVAAPNASAAS